MKLPRETVINDEKFYKSVHNVVQRLKRDKEFIIASEKGFTWFTLTDKGIIMQTTQSMNRKISYTALMVFMEIFDTIPFQTIRDKTDFGNRIVHELRTTSIS